MTISRWKVLQSTLILPPSIYLPHLIPFLAPKSHSLLNNSCNLLHLPRKISSLFVKPCALVQKDHLRRPATASDASFVPSKSTYLVRVLPLITILHALGTVGLRRSIIPCGDDWQCLPPIPTGVSWSGWRSTFRWMMMLTRCPVLHTRCVGSLWFYDEGTDNITHTHTVTYNHTFRDRSDSASSSCGGLLTCCFLLRSPPIPAQRWSSGRSSCNLLYEPANTYVWFEHYPPRFSLACTQLILVYGKGWKSCCWTVDTSPSRHLGEIFYSLW